MSAMSRPTHADGSETRQTHAEPDSPALCRCQSGMPLDQPIGPTPLTSTLVIGSLDILLHRGGAAETTTWRFVCNGSYRAVFYIYRDDKYYIIF